MHEFSLSITLSCGWRLRNYLGCRSCYYSSLLKARHTSQKWKALLAAAGLNILVLSGIICIFRDATPSSHETLNLKE
ncbi:hypothetical protein CI102_5079 [Trichoderma harzianum]|nr:hypothetical protein CI102_5079 [Trichoderma harzianum]